MFLSIPKQFFVPVVFSENFVLNNENNNMEYDTNDYRESTKSTVLKSNVTQNMTIENKSVEMIKEANKNNDEDQNIKASCQNVLNEMLLYEKNNPYGDIDNEYVLENTKQEDDNCD